MDRDLFLRSRTLRGVVIAVFLVLAGNLFLMMGPGHQGYKKQAVKNMQVRRRMPAPRGRIMDRDGTLLAMNLFRADITLPGSCLIEVAGDASGPDSTGVRFEPDATLQRLMTWFDLPREETLERLVQQRDRRGARDRLVLVPDAKMPRITAVREAGDELPGVQVVSRPRRRYPQGRLFAHTVGYVGEVGVADTSSSEGGYRLGDMIGKQGVEAAFEDELRGKAGRVLQEVNAIGLPVGKEKRVLKPVVPGKDVTVSLSVPLQAAMKEVIGDQVACGVAMDTRTGEILTAYSNPAFDPNLMTAGITPEVWNELVNDPAKPFFNRVVQASYPPASLYKPVTSLACLQLGLIGRESRLEPCHGGWTFGDRYFRCWKHTGHGEIDHTEALVQSCDTYYYQLAERLDIDELAAAARAFGLGRRCSRIFPEEVSGNVPDSAWYDRRFGPGGWTRGVLLNNAIGQGELLVTPLQMAVLTARIASDGAVPDPVFVLSPAQETIHVPSLPFAPVDLRWCREALHQVVSRGTGKSGAVEGVEVAGKTGTAQNPHGEDHAWFMCYAPVREPEVAVVLIVENAGSGGSQAAPLAASWLRTYFLRTGRLPAEKASGDDAAEGGSTP